MRTRTSILASPLLAIALAIWVFTSGCSCEELLGFLREPQAAVDEPSKGTIGGVSFSYPGNWTYKPSSITENGVLVHMAELESAGSSYMMVQVYNQPLALDVELDSLINEGLVTMKAAVNDMSAGLMGATGTDLVQPFTRNMLGAPRAARRAVVQYMVLNEPLPYRLEVVGAVLGDRSVLVMYGIAEEDWGAASPGYDQVIDSMAISSMFPGQAQVPLPGIVPNQPQAVPQPQAIPQPQASPR